MQTVTAPFCGDGILQAPGSSPVSGTEECDGAVGLTKWICLSDDVNDKIAGVVSDMNLWPKCTKADCKRQCPTGFSPCYNDGTDTDGDGLTNACDSDADGDGVPANPDGTPAATGTADCDDRNSVKHGPWGLSADPRCQAAWNPTTKTPDLIPWPNWAGSEPNDWPALWNPATNADAVHHEEDCVQMYDDGRWNDLSCANASAVYGICNTGGGAGGTEPMRTPTMMSVPAAQDFCVDYGGLAIIDSSARNTAVKNACGTGNSCWIGLDDISEANHWVWTGCYLIPAGRPSSNSCASAPSAGSPITTQTACETMGYYWINSSSCPGGTGPCCSLTQGATCNANVGTVTCAKAKSPANNNCMWCMSSCQNTCIN